MRCPSLRATNTFEAICFYSDTRSTDASFHGVAVLSRTQVAVAKGKETATSIP